MRTVIVRGDITYIVTERPDGSASYVVDNQIYQGSATYNQFLRNVSNLNSESII